ncbi:hypothetical protein ODV17_08530 [Lactobacillus amylovorus]|nr:hypothetical protein [Lactobacillus amylovorus]MDB6240057.1 hypothetical protein [Lactobacillus amylovorus]
MIKDKLLSMGVDEDQIIYINFENPEFFRFIIFVIIKFRFNAESYIGSLDDLFNIFLH